MTDYKAAPEQWAALEEQSAPEYDSTILKLRARVEALEGKYETMRLATLEWGKDVENLQRWSDQHLMRIERLEAAQQQPEPIDEEENDRRFHACMDLIHNATPEQIRAAAGLPERSSLVEQVADALCHAQLDSPSWEPEARAALAQPEPQGPTDEEIEERFQRWWFDEGSGMRPLDGEDSEEHARRVSQIAWHNGAYCARWGRPAIEPVPVDERLPGPEDCCVNPRNGQGQWCWGWVQHDSLPYSGRWRIMRSQWLTDEALFWLPHWALPVPQEGG
jgi:hypothetical protein